MLVGQPLGDNWDALNTELTQTFETARAAYMPTAKDKRNRRGEFVGATCGISYGGGQTVGLEICVWQP